MIYIMAHKPFDAPDLPGYAVLQVGAALHEPMGCLRDDTGDNISAQNPTYCELTGLYWVWKNRKDPVKGLVHYRRYFTRNPFSGKAEDILPFDALAELLRDADMVLPTRKYNHITNREQLLHSGRVRPCYLDALRECMGRRCPEDLRSFDACLQGNTGHYMNMLVARREVFDAYCAWLFPLLFEAEQLIRSRWPEDDPQRLCGYLSERLIDVFVARRQLRVAERPVANLALTPYWRWRLWRRNYTNRFKFLFHKSGEQK